MTKATEWVRDQLWEQVRGQLWSRVWSQVEGQVVGQVGSQGRDHVEELINDKSN